MDDFTKSDEYDLQLYENLQYLINCANGKILSRGKDYYANNFIESLTTSPYGCFTAEVWGSQDELYNITVKTDEVGNITNYSCDCPYDWSDICKHLVAVFIAIQNKEYQHEESLKAAFFHDLAEVIRLSKPEKLINFVLDYAKIEDHFKNELSIAFDKPNHPKELSQIKRQVQRIISCYAYNDYLDYNCCNAIYTEFNSILALAERRILKGALFLGFSIGLHIMTTCAKLVSMADFDVYTKSSTLDYSLNVINLACAKIAAIGNAEECTAVFKHCIKTVQKIDFDIWSHWHCALLHSCIPMVTNENVDELYATLEYLISAKHEQLPDYYEVDEKLIRLEVIKHLEGETAAKKYIEANIALDEFRNIAVDIALEHSDYTLAQRLCVERLNRSSDSDLHVLRKDWLMKLYEVYEKSDNTNGKIKIAEELLLGGELSYYHKLKHLYKLKGVWEEEYPLLKVRCSNVLPYHLYMDILKTENELLLLLEEVKRYPDSVFIYGKFLAPAYPLDVYMLMKMQIEKQAEKSTNRGMYTCICNNLTTLFKIGGRLEAKTLIADFRVTYRRRPAMLDELASLEQRLAKIK